MTIPVLMEKTQVLRMRKAQICLRLLLLLRDIQEWPPKRIIRFIRMNFPKWVTTLKVRDMIPARDMYLILYISIRMSMKSNRQS